MPIGIIASLIICTILYIAVVAVLTGMVPYTQINKDAGVSSAFHQAGLPWAEFIIAAAGVAGITSRAARDDAQRAARVSWRWPATAWCRRSSSPTSIRSIRRRGRARSRSASSSRCLSGLLPIDALLHLTNIGTLFAFVIVCAAVLIMRRISPHTPRPFRCPLVPLVPILGIGSCLLLMLSLPAATGGGCSAGWRSGLVIYFFYGRYHSTLGKELVAELAEARRDAA